MTDLSFCARFVFVLSIALVYVGLNCSNAQSLQRGVYKKGIESVQIYRKGWVMGFPIIKMDSANQIVLSFDELGNNYNSYKYKLIHCTYDWKPSDIEPIEYLQGFQTNDLLDSKHSTITAFQYLHYEVEIPNDRVKILYSGNYIIQIVDALNEDNIVLQERFYVLDSKISSTAHIHRPSMAQFMSSKQQIDITVHHQNYPIDDVEQELKLVVMQNFRPDNPLTQLKPRFIKPGEVIYDSDSENLFDGGNEFRWFDCKNIYFKSERVHRIDAIGKYYHIELEPDENGLRKPYQYLQDLNGRYLIKQDGATDNGVDPDYVFVHFSLPMPAQLLNANVYVYGSFSAWSLTDKYKMDYNFETKAYEAVLLLKQGLYNYCYVQADEGGATMVEEAELEGSFWQTENEYQILLYHRSKSNRYDQLVGINFYNSQKRF